MICSGTSKNAESTSKSWFSNFNLNGLRNVDPYLLLTVLGLLVFGLIMVYSSSFIYATERTGDGYAFIRKQIIFVGIGLILLWFGARVHHQFWYRLAYPAMILATVLLAVVLIPGIGAKVGGAQRWIQLGGISFQPAEVAKFAVILFVARQITKKISRMESFTAGVLGNLLLPLPILLLMLVQPDFGSVAMIGLSVFILMFLGGVPLRYLTLVGVLGIAALSGLVLSSPYRLDRFMTFLNPWEDPTGKGFQILQSLVGLHNGSVTGVGLGNGKEKLFFLPEAHNDFIFAVIGEELGFIGVFVLIAVFFFFIARGLTIAWRSLREREDLFGMLLAAGITLIIGIQGLVNMGVVMGMLPTKGLNLPFISYGGTAMTLNLLAVGILLSISRGISLPKNG